MSCHPLYSFVHVLYCWKIHANWPSLPKLYISVKTWNIPHVSLLIVLLTFPIVCVPMLVLIPYKAIFVDPCGTVWNNVSAQLRNCIHVSPDTIFLDFASPQVLILKWCDSYLLLGHISFCRQNWPQPLQPSKLNLNKYTRYSVPRLK